MEKKITQKSNKLTQKKANLLESTPSIVANLAAEGQSRHQEAQNSAVSAVFTCAQHQPTKASSPNDLLCAAVNPLVFKNVTFGMELSLFV